MSEYSPEPGSEFQRLTEGLEMGTKEQALRRLTDAYEAFDQLAHALKGTEHSNDEWIETHQEHSQYDKPVTTTFERWDVGSIRIEQRIGRGRVEFDVGNDGWLCVARGYQLEAEGVKLPLTTMSDTQMLLYMAMLVDEIKGLVHADQARIKFL